MNKSIIPLSPGLLAMLSKGASGIVPFRREIFLLEITVAGTTFCSDIHKADKEIAPEKVPP